MILKSIELENFKCFDGKYKVDFDKLTLVNGANGVGKTTLILDSILFGLYGYTNTTLKDLVTKGKNKCAVTLYFNDLIIRREYPTKIFIDGYNFATNIEAQNFIIKKFGNLDIFKKFRLLDINKGINILEEGPVALQKTLFNVFEDKFNKVRQKLLDKKREREIFNKDKAVVYKHYPSQKRLDFINLKLLELTEEIYDLEKEINSIEEDYLSINNKKAKKERDKEYFNSQKNKILSYNYCPTCKRELDKVIKNKLLEDFNNKIVELNTAISNILSEIETYKDLLNYLKNLRQSLYEKKNKLTQLQLKLENRMKLKDYKYTQKDVEIAKEAINEFDNFCNLFIKETLVMLEPIINNVINKIGFNLVFVLDNKRNLDIRLQKDNKDYRYNELSTGQKLILSIAFKIALLLSRNESGLIIADEGLTNLDYTNLNYIVDLFKDLPFQLIMALHRFDDIIESVKVINLEEILCK